MFGSKRKEVTGGWDKLHKCGHFHTDALLDVVIFIK